MHIYSSTRILITRFENTKTDNKEVYMTTIRVFLASSIKEFERERQTLMAFFQMLNNIYHDRGIFFEMEICEALSSQMLDIRTQEMYNSTIRESEYFYIIIGKQAGKYTIEEFNVALESYQKNGLPRIYTFFQKFDGEENLSAAEFKKYISQELQHYYNAYTHIDTIKLNLLIELCRDSRLKAVMKVEDGKALLNGQMLMAMDNIPLYNRNETLRKLLKEKEELDQEFVDLAGLGNSPAAVRLRQKNAERREQVANELHELEIEMLDLCMQMEENRSLGHKLNWRQKKAMEMMDLGDYDAAKAILRDEQWKTEVQHAKQIISGAEGIIYEYISGKKVLIQTIKATGVNAETAKEIILIYEEICELAEKIRDELDTLYGFAYFLWNQRQYLRAIEVCEREIMLLKLSGGPLEQLARAKWLEGAIYNRQNDLTKSESLFREALRDFEQLEEQEPGKFPADIATICNSLALLFYMRQEFEEAELLHRRALEIRRKLAEDNPYVYKDTLGDSYNNYAIILIHKKEFDEAEKYLTEALKIRRSLAENGSPAYKSSLAKTCKNLGNLMKNKNQLAEAEKYYRDTIDLFRELRDVNPDAYDHDYANACERLAKLYRRLRRFDEAEQLYREAEATYSGWNDINQEAFGKYLANLYHQWAELYHMQGEYQTSKLMYEKAMDLYAALNQTCPGMYLKNVRWVYSDLEKLKRKMKYDET